MKDKTAQFWIDQLIQKSRDLQHIRLINSGTKDRRLLDKNLKGDALQSVKLEIKKTIQRELFDWVITQPAAEYEKLPADSCAFFVFKLSHLVFAKIQSSGPE